MPESIVTLGQEHLDRCVALYVEVFNAPPWKNKWTPEAARARLSDSLNEPNAFGMAMLDGDLLIGFALGRKEQWYDCVQYQLEEFCVKSDRRRSGNGTRLLSQLEQTLRENGVKRLYLLTTKGEESEKFYYVNGYRTNSRMILMTRQL